MKDESGYLCVWCDNGDCVLNQIGAGGLTPNFCMPEITDCNDYHDCRVKEELVIHYRMAHCCLNCGRYKDAFTGKCNPNHVCNYFKPSATRMSEEAHEKKKHAFIVGIISLLGIYFSTLAIAPDAIPAVGPAVAAGIIGSCGSFLGANVARITGSGQSITSPR